MSESILIVVAHPDDECFMGGTIARLGQEGHTVRVAVATDGVGARYGASDDAAIRRRAVEFDMACAMSGVLQCFGVGMSSRDNRLDTVPLLDLVQAVEKMKTQIQPSTVYTHHAGDLNIDHQLIARAVVTATRPYPGQVVKNIYGFEVPGSTEWAVPGAVPFVPTRFVRLTEGQYYLKKQALACYTSELRDAPHPRSPAVVAALAEVRWSQCGVELAEAFTVVREIV